MVDTCYDLIEEKISNGATAQRKGVEYCKKTPRQAGRM